MREPIARTASGAIRGLWRDQSPRSAVCLTRRRRSANDVLPPRRPSDPGKASATQHGMARSPRNSVAARRGDGRLRRPQDEDCLTLTICTPAPDAAARPVLVWLHGGAWITGAGSLDWYDGARLAREGDIVFVGVNYRLGALGWLHRPGIVDVEPGYPT